MDNRGEHKIGRGKGWAKGTQATGPPGLREGALDLKIKTSIGFKRRKDLHE